MYQRFMYTCTFYCKCHNLYSCFSCSNLKILTLTKSTNPNLIVLSTNSNLKIPGTTPFRSQVIHTITAVLYIRAS